MIEMAESSESVCFRLWGGQNHPFHMALAHIRDGDARITECETLAGTHMFMRWETWDKHGPMKSDGPGVQRGEDVYFCQRVRAAGGRIGVASPPCVIDCGITASNGEPSPGAADKPRVQGVLYE
jgi:hypothetical protein